VPLFSVGRVSEVRVDVSQPDHDLLIFVVTTLPLPLLRVSLSSILSFYPPKPVDRPLLKDRPAAFLL